MYGDVRACVRAVASDDLQELFQVCSASFATMSSQHMQTILLQAWRLDLQHKYIAGDVVFRSRTKAVHDAVVAMATVKRLANPENIASMLMIHCACAGGRDDTRLLALALLFNEEFVFLDVVLKGAASSQSHSDAESIRKFFQDLNAQKCLLFWDYWTRGRAEHNVANLQRAQVIRTVLDPSLHASLRQHVLKDVQLSRHSIVMPHPHYKRPSFLSADTMCTILVCEFRFSGLRAVDDGVGKIAHYLDAAHQLRCIEMFRTRFAFFDSGVPTTLLRAAAKSAALMADCELVYVGRIVDPGVSLLLTDLADPPLPFAGEWEVVCGESGRSRTRALSTSADRAPDFADAVPDSRT